MDVGVVAGVIVAVLVLWVALLVLFWLLRPKDVPVSEVIRLIPDALRLLRAIVGDRSTPRDVRLVLVGLLAWIVSPIDLIPEFIPVLGPLDDIVVAVVAWRYVRRRMGVESLQQRWSGTDDGFRLLLRAIGSG